MGLDEQEVMWLTLSLKMLKVLAHESVQLTRSVKDHNDPQFILDHKENLSDQYDILEEFFNRVSRYLETHGTAKTLASKTLQEIVSILVCQNCGEI
jgi:hypothetical protein